MDNYLQLSPASAVWIKTVDTCDTCNICALPWILPLPAQSRPLDFGPWATGFNFRIYGGCWPPSPLLSSRCGLHRWSWSTCPKGRQRGMMPQCGIKPSPWVPAPWLRETVNVWVSLSFMNWGKGFLHFLWGLNKDIYVKQLAEWSIVSAFSSYFTQWSYKLLRECFMGLVRVDVMNSRNQGRKVSWQRNFQTF